MKNDIPERDDLQSKIIASRAISSDAVARIGSCGSLTKFYCLACFLLILTGCDQLSRQKVENPVIGAPPPRIKGAELASGPLNAAGKSQLRSSQASVLPVGLDPMSVSSAENFTGTQVVAMVNGTPILSSDIIDPNSHMPYSELFERVRSERDQGRMSEAQYQELRKSFLVEMEKNLDPFIERKLLAGALRAMMPPEAMQGAEDSLDRYFDLQVAEMKKKMNVTTREEVDSEMRKQGLSLAQLRENVADQEMASSYLKSQKKTTPVISRSELYDYYQSHLDEYAQPAQVRWQQIVVYYRDHGGRNGAFESLKKSIDVLKQGESFSSVASQYSNGPRAQDGGQWDWTRAGSLSDLNIEKELFNLPIGRISRPIEGEGGYHLVKVNERQRAAHTPFTEVQGKIQKTLQVEAENNATREIIQNVRTASVVETIFDDNSALESNETVIR